MTSEVIEDEKQFYSKAKTYWKEVPPTVDGMLGGYGHISSIDISSSRKFLQRFLRVGRSGMPSRSRGCGPGGPAWSAQGAAFYPSHHGAFGAWLVSAPQALRVGRGGVRLGASVSGLPRGGAGGCAGSPGTRTEASSNCSDLSGVTPSLSCHVCGLLGCGHRLLC